VLGSGSIWTPALLSGKLLWVDDSTLGGDISGGVVASWTDKSGAGHPLTQATGSKKPAGSLTGGPNGLGYVETDGVDDFLRVTFTLAQPSFVFLVTKKITSAQNNPRFMDGASANSMDLFTAGAAPGSNTTLSLSAAAGTFTSNSATLTDWNRLELQLNGASSKIKIGDGSYATGTVNSSSPGGIIIGCWGDQSSAPIQARYNTVIVCSTIPSAAELSELHNWAKNRTGV